MLMPLFLYVGAWIGSHFVMDGVWVMIIAGGSSSCDRAFVLFPIWYVPLRGGDRRLKANGCRLFYYFRTDRPLFLISRFVEHRHGKDRPRTNEMEKGVNTLYILYYSCCRES